MGDLLRRFTSVNTYPGGFYTSAANTYGYFDDYPEIKKKSYIIKCSSCGARTKTREMKCTFCGSYATKEDIQQEIEE